MDDVTIVDGRIARDHDRLCANGEAIGCLDLRVIAAIGAHYFRPGTDASAIVSNGTAQRVQVVQRVKLSLPRETDGWSGVEFFQRRLFRPRHIQPRSLAGIKFLFQVTLSLVRRIKQITVQALEAAIDLFLPNNLLDPVNRCRMALGGEARPLFPVTFFDIVKTVIESINEVCRRPSGHAVADRPII